MDRNVKEGMPRQVEREVDMLKNAYAGRIANSLLEMHEQAGM
jgi:hypothetical protein